MNKFTAVGLVSSAMAGDRVIVVTRTADDARDGLQQIADLGLADEGVVRIDRANGRGKVTAHSGGTIRFIPQGGLSGASADTVLLEDGVRVDDRLASYLRAITSASPRGEVLRA